MPVMMHRRVVISRAGRPEVLKVVQEPCPEPAPAEARIRVLCAGVAYGDVLRRAGKLPGAPRIPYTPGYDMVGVVDGLGRGVSRVAVGDRVAAFTETGSYAECICVPERLLVRVPADIDPAIVASVPLNYITAHQMLHRVAAARAGERLLIHGAAGGFGTAALQLGVLAGLELYGTASPRKHDLVRRLGGTPIDYKSQNFVQQIQHLTGDGVDIVFDPIGGRNWRRSFRTLRRGGRLVAFGISSIFDEGALPTYLAFGYLLLWKLMPNGKSATFYGINHTHGSNPERCAADLKAIIHLLVEGKIAPVVGCRVPLDEAAEAHRLIEDAAVEGKIILVCSEA
jgi:NADPH:quinone reductase-like Zn-dependent oxidoreductase